MFITGKYIDIFNSFDVFILNGLSLSLIKLDIDAIQVRVRSNIENNLISVIIKIVISNCFNCYNKGFAISIKSLKFSKNLSLSSSVLKANILCLLP